MTTMTRCISIMVTLVFLSSAVGCGEKAEIPCKDLEARSDAFAKAELEKRCPRRGGPFKPSPVRNW